MKTKCSLVISIITAIISVLAVLTFTAVATLVATELWKRVLCFTVWNILIMGFSFLFGVIFVVGTYNQK